ncbi:hypothetical protein [Micromonospora tarensis]|uniref:Uncharacterized protein n=1 Tax=Micromonospora tarensis TaxID=2806100 RepID=A0ABS1YCY5_9ACTN|nr:hypothetical protein [Micromonospora tarensis]MBM0275144.1 hypothetical protein [Micromonospora tarensis]
MTHPPGGGGGNGGGGGGTTGPGRLIDRAADAAAAGSYGRSASPLSGQHRADNYRRQTGRNTFTPKQWRRFVHKAHRAGTKVAVA